GLLPGRAVLAQADGDLDARVGQVLGVGMALRAIADHGDLLALDEGEVGVLVVINLHVFPLFGGSVRENGNVVSCAQTLSTRSPRPTPHTPERTVSRIRAGSMAPMKASSLP